jgi:transaldolase
MINNYSDYLGTLTQSGWLDYIQRYLIVESRGLIEDNGLRGISSNPTIFEKAIIDAHACDADIKSMALLGKEPREIYDTLSRRDVQIAADKFRAEYGETDGRDGYVCLEVDPHLAHDTNGTILEVRRLWTALDRPNVLIKVPATLESLPAIKQLTSEGINLNMTWLFSLPRYRQVAEAYIDGIEKRLAQGKPAKGVCSVVSFFVSRIDAMADPLIEKIIAHGGNQRDLARHLLGKAAVASAKVSYQMYKEIFDSVRFKRLKEKGAGVQGILWTASAAANPDQVDTRFIEAIVDVSSVTPVPVETLSAFHSHGVSRTRLEYDVEDASRTIERLSELGLGIDSITRALEDESIDKFTKLFDLLMETLAQASSPKPGDCTPPIVKLV